MKILILLLALIAGITAPMEAAAASGKPLAISVSCTNVTEGGTVQCALSKSGGNGRAVSVSYITADGTAKAPADYAARSGVLYLGASAPFTIPTASDTLTEGDETFTVKAVVTSGTVRPSAQTSVTIIDHVVVPPPPPPPVPAPVPTGWVPSPTPAGASYVDDGADPALALQPSWGNGAIPVSAAPDVVGALRFNCTAGQVLPDDPIVYPGQPGKSHLHQFYGNQSADASSTYTSLRTSGTSTCNRGVAVPGNRSAYWMPAMLAGDGSVVKPNFVIIYYKRRPASDPKCSLTSGDPKAEGNCLTIPNGLRFIFGYDMLTSEAPTGELWYNCQGPTAKPGAYANLPLALSNCPAGNQLGAIIKAPGCWDGKNLDSPNHRDHVAYPGYGTWGYLRCPATHPYRIPDFTLSAWYPVASGMHLSCDVMVQNMPAGTCFHADYWEAWNDKVKAMWTQNDIDKMLNASGGDLGNGEQLRGAQ